MPSVQYYTPIASQSPVIEERPLSDSSDYGDEPLKEKGIHSVGLRERAISKFSSSFGVALVILCTVINAFISLRFHSNPGSTGLMPGAAASLRRPSQFVGLDQVPYNATRLEPGQLAIPTFPTILHQIDKTRPDVVLPGTGHLHFTSFGSVSPENALFLARGKISTIVQFRARDYGMEHCVLQISLHKEFQRKPGVEHNHEDTGSPPDERSWQISGDTSNLEVWSLDTHEWLDTSKLSYASRPKRLNRLGSLRVRAGQEISTHRFPCPSDSIQTFELFCTSPNCNIDVWQDRKAPAMGIFLMQSSSL